MIWRGCGRKYYFKSFSRKWLGIIMLISGQDSYFEYRNVMVVVTVTVVIVIQIIR
jgi:hypothetical protein